MPTDDRHRSGVHNGRVSVLFAVPLDFIALAPNIVPRRTIPRLLKQFKFRSRRGADFGAYPLPACEILFHRVLWLRATRTDLLPGSSHFRSARRIVSFLVKWTTQK